ncbi:MAG: glycoside hydrolase family 57 protein [Sporocytophaga sp.]|uniref:glycoside hydrolase family 57 protein n=1 Tax=Sporocytophaga sp. TaxID=2231183 RepID=UPI001B2A1CEB|nr:glycoside hydrolase family 57 protein [Sporocytophaga sp.]MBO9699104.1 glycoside hydrolase family 57 protein [Sporocytophaga sp.]
MPAVCFYFQVHQPYRLKQYSFFNIGNDHNYSDERLNKEILNKVADKCYLPANKLMLELIKKFNKQFRISYSISGIALEQFEKYRPDVLESFIDLARTGCVEFLGETYHHSLSYLYSKDEFVRQIELHEKKIKHYFNQEPVVFRNTELIYNNDLADFIQKMGYKAILCEGVDSLLQGRTPNQIYTAPNNKKIKCLLKNFRLSDDIAFRFSNRDWPEYPLTAQKFASWLHNAHSADTINLFMDYETFGEHQWKETGIFEFMEHLPGEILKNKDFSFKTVGEVADDYQIKDVYDAHATTSWADSERDLSAWLSNSMQSESLSKLYAMEEDVKNSGDKDLIERWARLQSSDLFYYMCTKYWSDGVVHKYFSPYNSPYDSYIYFINALADLEVEVNKHSLATARVF